MLIVPCRFGQQRSHPRRPWAGHLARPGTGNRPRRWQRPWTRSAPFPDHPSGLRAYYVSQSTADKVGEAQMATAIEAWDERWATPDGRADWLVPDPRVAALVP